MSTETGDTPTDEQRLEALARDRREWFVDYEAEPAITRNAFARGWEAALAATGVAPPAPSADREKLIAEAKASCHYNDGHVLKRVTDALAAQAPVTDRE